MGWLSRRGRSQGAAEADDSAAAPALAEPLEVPLRPVVEKVGAAERSRIEEALEALAAAGVDVDDLASLGAGLDAAFTAWEAAAADDREPHERIVDRFAMGIGEHLHRHTDLRWQVVTDGFGTDLAVADSLRGDFVVVPTNLVAVRWLRREKGWVPGVVGHLVRRRNERHL